MEGVAAARHGSDSLQVGRGGRVFDELSVANGTHADVFLLLGREALQVLNADSRALPVEIRHALAVGNNLRCVSSAVKLFRDLISAVSLGVCLEIFWFSFANAVGDPRFKGLLEDLVALPRVQAFFVTFVEQGLVVLHSELTLFFGLGAQPI